MKKQVFLTISLAFFGLLFGERADAWVQGTQPFPNGEAPVVLYRFCMTPNCDGLSSERWRGMIQTALDTWNAAGSSFRFSTRPVRFSDDPCNVPNAVVVIVSEPGRQCPGDSPPSRGEYAGRTEFGPGNRVRVYIRADPTSPAQLHLVAIPPFLVHELGHVVGLGHPDEAGQQVRAIMNSGLEGPFDTQLFPDDIAGIQALYPPASTSGGGGVLESPAQGANLSGIGFISGWKCDAGEITVRIDGGSPLPMAMDQPRADTASQCDGEIENGFIAQINWNHVNTGGTHTAVAYDAGVEFARTTFYVGTTGQEFVKGLSGRMDVPNIPVRGECGRFRWNESTQHLEFMYLVGRNVAEPSCDVLY